MLERHGNELKVMGDVLQEEQSRQSDKLQEQRKSRAAKKSKDNLMRQIKLAEIKKVKHEQEARAVEYQQSGGDLRVTQAEKRRQEALQKCIEKASLMQKPCQKQCFSRQIYFKRHILN